jgi:hypothetical protein
MAEKQENFEENCKFVKEVSALILRHFRKGCLCPIQTKTFAKLLSKSFEIIDGVGDDVSAVSKTLLSFLSCLRTLVRTLIQVDNFEGEEEGSSLDGTLCRHFYDWILILVRYSLFFNEPEPWHFMHFIVTCQKQRTFGSIKVHTSNR